MEYLTSILIPPQDKVLYGLPVSAMVRSGMRVQADGKAKGRLPYVTAYPGFEKGAEGYFFPFFIKDMGEKMTFLKNGQTTRINGSSFEAYNVLKVEPGQIWTVLVDGRNIARLDFSETIFEEKKGDRRMNIPFYDDGICGIALTGHIGTLKKDDDKEIVFDNALPIGTRLINLIAIASGDMAGAESISVGDGATEEKYGSITGLSAGKATVTDGKLADIAAGTVGLKPNTKITEGSVDVYATVIRLEA